MKRRKSRYVDQRGIEACIEQLQAVIDGLRSGSMALEEEEQSLLLRPRGLLDFEVRVEQLETKELLRLELSWRLGQRGGDAAAPASGPREVLDGAVWEGPIKAWPERERAAEPQAPAGALAGEMAAVMAEGSDPVDAGDEVDADDEIEVEPLDALEEEEAAALKAATLEGAAGDARDVESGVMHVAPFSRVERSDRLWSAEDPISSWPPQRSVMAEYHQLYADACTVGSDGQWHIDRDQLVQSLARAGVDALTQQELYSFALQADQDRTSLFNARVIAALERASQRPAAAVG